MVDPTAEPVAHHTPVLVPLHWHQQSVKAGLDQDIALSVLKPVQVTVALLLIFLLKL